MLNYWCVRNQDILPEILKDEKKLAGLSFDYTATLWFAVNSPKSVITPFFGLNNSPCLGIPRDQKTFDMFCDAAKNMQKLKRLSEFSALLQEISHSLRIAQGGFSTIDGSKAFEIFTHLIASQKTIAEKHRVLDKFFPHSSLSRYDFAVPWLQFLKKDPKLVNEKDFFLNFVKRRAQSIGDNFGWATPSLENLLNYCELKGNRNRAQNKLVGF